MDADKLKAIVEETVREFFARALAAEVIRRYNARPVSVAAFFTGALLDIRLVMDAMRNLQGNGFSIHAVLSRSAESLIGVSAVKDALNSGEVYPENDAPSAVWDNAELILIPTLTVNTAAKIACCVCDSIIPDAVSKSLMRGKPVIATIEGCCPECKQRIEKYAGKIPPAYAQTMSANLRKLREYGMVLTSSKNFERRVRRYTAEQLRNLGNTAPAVFSHEPRTAIKESSVKSKRIVGMADLMDKPSGGRVAVGRDAIITQLAQDHAALHGITIVRS